MIIVAGWLRVAPDVRDEYLADALEATRAARRAPGCVEFHLGADPLDPGRIVVLEQWQSASDVEAFRGSGPSPQQAAQLLDAAVHQYEITSSARL